ncbi:hypothetical protein FRX31_034199, partial [Thalictrum thalictroides]
MHDDRVGTLGDPFAKRNKDFKRLKGQKFSGDEGEVAIVAYKWLEECKNIFERMTLSE